MTEDNVEEGEVDKLVKGLVQQVSQVRCAPHVQQHQEGLGSRKTCKGTCRWVHASTLALLLCFSQGLG